MSCCRTECLAKCVGEAFIHRVVRPKGEHSIGFELISNCGSRALLDTHAAVFDRYFRYQMIALNYRGDEPARQHQALLECALARDSVRAKSVLFDHVTGCVAHALATGTIR